MYNLEILHEILKSEDCNPFNNDGTVLPPSNNVYTRIAREITERGSKMSASDSDKDGEDKDDETFQISKRDDNDVVEEFDLFLSKEQWKEINPDLNSQSKKTKHITFKDPWTNVLSKELWEQKQLRCCFIFKYGRVNHTEQGKYYATFVANCKKECSAELRGRLVKKPEDGKNILFKCTLKNYQPDVRHVQKRPLKGPLRTKVASNLVDGRKHASTWRYEEARKTMKFGDPLPPIIFNPAVLRKAKQQEADKRLQMLYTEPVTNLVFAKHNDKQNIIRNVGADPFYCIYFSEEQLMLHKKIHKQGKSARLIIDATGFGKKVKYSNSNTSPPTFLYQIMCADDKGSYPVYQMVSSRHDACHIGYFFDETLRLGAPIPRMIITDFGKALLLAAAKSYARCADLQDYMNRCFMACKSDGKAHLPHTYLRLDVSHFVNMMAKWECLKKKNTPVRHFYLRAMAQAYQMTDIEEVEKLLLSVMVVALCPALFSDEETSNHPESQKYFYNVRSVIKKTNYDEIAVDQLSIESVDEVETKCKSKWSRWARKLFQKGEDIAQTCHTGATSAYYNVELAQKLRVLYSYAPLWTAVMLPLFQQSKIIATSAAVESEFSHLKNRELPDHRFKRIDKCILKHIDYIEGKLLLSAADRYDDNAKNQSKFQNESLPNQVVMGDDFSRNGNRTEGTNGKNKDHRASSGDELLSASELECETSSFELSAKKNVRQISESPKEVQNSNCVVAETKDFTVEAMKKKNTRKYESETPSSTGSNDINEPDRKRVKSIHQLEQRFDLTLRKELTDERIYDISESITKNLNKVENWGGQVLKGKLSDLSEEQDDDEQNLSNRSIHNLILSELPIYHSTCVEEEMINIDNISTQLVQVNEEEGVHISNAKAHTNLRKKISQFKKKYIPKKSRQTYLEKCPNFDDLKNSKNIGLPVILNGNICKAIEFEGSTVLVNNTCAFDSICQVQMDCMSTSESYKRTVENPKFGMAQLNLKILKRKAVMEDHYRMRLEILLTTGLFKIQDRLRQMKKLDAQTNSIDISQRLLAKCPSFQQVATCYTCNKKQITTEPTLKINMKRIIEHGFQLLQETLDDLQVPILECCAQAPITYRSYGFHLFIDTDDFTHDNYINLIKLTQKTCLIGDIPKEITVDTKKYVLKGFVHHVPNGWHYIAFTYNGLGWYRYNDLERKRSRVVEAEEVNPSMLIYIQDLEDSADAAPPEFWFTDTS